MKIMKALTVLLAVFVAGVALAAKLSLAEARQRISKCIKDPVMLREVVKQLSPEDQVAFLGEINEAISRMPGADIDRNTAYLVVNREAVMAASAGNKTAMLAEVFATVSPEALTIINERFATELLNVGVDLAKNVEPDRFTRVALSVMEAVNKRCASVENSAERSTFAILMLLRASSDKVPGLDEKLIATLPEKARTTAQTEWIPAAMGRNQEQTYEPILKDVVNIRMRTNKEVIMLPGSQLLESLLGEIIEHTPMINNSIHDQPNRDDAPARLRDNRIPEPGGYPGQNI